MVVRHTLALMVLPLLLACPGDDGAAGDSTASSGSTSATSTGATAVGTSTGTQTPGGDTLGPGSGCCEPHDPAGCDEPNVVDCVCNMQAECCAFQWSESCVDLAMSSCAATCMPGGGDTTAGPVDPSAGSTDTGPGPGDDSSDSDSDSAGPMGVCCTPVKAPGCAADMALEACVCGQDEYCCKVAWDDKCVGVATGACGASC